VLGCVIFSAAPGARKSKPGAGRGESSNSSRSSPSADAIVGTLSYGQQKRVELARALACEPKLLLLDEMVSGMNQEETEDIARFVLDIRDELGITVLMIRARDADRDGYLRSRSCAEFRPQIAEGAPADIQGAIRP